MSRTARESVQSEFRRLPDDLPVERFGHFDHDLVAHGVTSRTPELPLRGNMSYFASDRPEPVAQSRDAWAAAIGYDPDRLVLGRQVHDTTVVRVDSRHAGAGARSSQDALDRVDGLITNELELPIAVMAADCVPLLMLDPATRAVAAIHAGWRGTVDGIAAKAVESMSEHFGTDPERLLVGFGPSICTDCYQVGDEVIERWDSGDWSENRDPVVTQEDGFHFDLRSANFIQLAQAGIGPANIEFSPICTRCANGTQFSRRGLGPRTGLFAAVIMLRD